MIVKIIVLSICKAPQSDNLVIAKNHVSNELILVLSMKKRLNLWFISIFILILTMNVCEVNVVHIIRKISNYS